jgi:hypothetical protein
VDTTTPANPASAGTLAVAQVRRSGHTGELRGALGVTADQLRSVSWSISFPTVHVEVD